jgi:uncharacterized membrane protein YphA (DoxX/SURF4 family)
VLAVIVVGIFAALRVMVGLIFVAAGGSKLLRVGAVRHTVQRYELVSTTAARALAPLLGPAEVLIGTALVLSPWAPALAPARLMALALLALFSGAIGSALYRGLRLPCGCGVLLGDHVITPATLWRNVALLAILLLDTALSP